MKLVYFNNISLLLTKMRHYLSIDEINEINQEIIQESWKIVMLENEIIKMKKNIEDKKNYIYNYCHHNKQIDCSINGEHTEFYCNKCGMSL